MDLIVRNVRLAHRPGGEPVDIGVMGGKIIAIGNGLAAGAEAYDAGRRLACGGLIETHIPSRQIPHPVDTVIIDAETPEQAVAEIRQPLAVFKRGQRTVKREPAELLRPA